MHCLVHGISKSAASWSAFNKQVSEYNTNKCVQEYLPVSPTPPEYPIWKEYLDSVLEMINDLEISHMFIHSDEAVYSKLCHILWKHQDIYQQVILLMGGFHQLRVMQKVLYKRYHCRDMKQVCVDADIIAKGSADQALEGRHYYRCFRLHKECFDVLVQLRIENITNHHKETDETLLAYLKDLRTNPSSSNIEKVLELPSFEKLCDDIMRYVDGTEENLTVTYLKDVSLMLTFVSAVREGKLSRHLEAEREMLSLTFAFDHPNYGRYCSYQHIYLNQLRVTNKEAYNDLTMRGFGASISGQSFSSIHGNLVTEYFNRTTKGTAGPFRTGFSTNTDAVNNWIKTIHIHSM